MNINLIKAFIFRDLEIEKTYRFNLLIKSLGIFFQLSIFFFIAKLVVNPKYFSFVLIGLMFSRFYQFWLNVFVSTIRHEQYWGTAEILFLIPQKPLQTLFYSTSGKFFVLMLEMMFYLLLGKLVFGAEYFFSLIKLMPFFIINSLTFAGLGLIAGSFIMYFKRGDPVNWLVVSAFDLISGVYFPLKVLPHQLRVISNMLPTTSSLNIWRNILLRNEFPATSDIFIQIIWGVVMIILGIFVFGKAFTLTKENGELGSY